MSGTRSSSGADYSLKIDIDTSLADKAQKRITNSLSRLSKVEKMFNNNRLSAARKLLTIENKIARARSGHVTTRTRNTTTAKKDVVERPKVSLNKGDLSSLNRSGRSVDALKNKSAIGKVKSEIHQVEKEVSALAKKIDRKSSRRPSRGSSMGPPKPEKKKSLTSPAPKSSVNFNQSAHLSDDIKAKKNDLRIKGGLLDKGELKQANAKLDNLQAKVNATSNPRELRKLRRSLSGINKDINSSIRNVDRLNKKIQLQEMAVTNLRSSAIGLAKSYASIYAGLDAIKYIITTTKRLETANVALVNSSGSVVQAAKDYEFVKQMTQELGLETISTAENFGKFAAAAKFGGIQGDEARKVFTNLSKAVAGAALDQERADLVFLGFQQTLSKGVLSMQEVRQQIGESLPQAMQALELATGKSGKELFSFIESGEAVSGDVIPRWAEELAKLSSESGALAVATGTLNAKWNRFKNQLTEVMVVFGQLGSSSLLGGILSISGEVLWIIEKMLKVLRNVLVIVGLLDSEFKGTEDSVDGLNQSLDKTYRKLSLIKSVIMIVKGSIQSMVGRIKLLLSYLEAFTANISKVGFIDAFSKTADDAKAADKRSLKRLNDKYVLSKGNRLKSSSVTVNVTNQNTIRSTDPELAADKIQRIVSTTARQEIRRANSRIGANS